ncbi:ABC transporter ATP-binding protein [Candidatus Gracilibacteria bacterium]|nr:ABC transporter ATP-binding protein [Candidatus Gracilibacteria bacterium]
MTAAIETINLTRRYDRMVALDQLNLTVGTGNIYGFIGPNGAGKTTTLRLLAGLLEPSSGEVRLMGQPLRLGRGDTQRLVGYMPDFFGVYDDLRVWEYLDFFARCYGLDAARRRTTVNTLLDLVDLGHKRDAFVQTLSRGMQQRLCLAHALVHDPPVLLLDEPASGLDPRARVELRELLRTLRDMGKTVLLSSHILSELAEVCTEIGIIDSGKMVVSGPVDAVQRQLQGTARLRIRLLRERERERAVALLQAQLEAPDEAAVQISSVRLDHSDPMHLLVELAQPDEEQQTRLLAFLMGQQLPISEFKVQSENLEELFLRLTTQLPAVS